jgi:hypothetical protein
MRPMCEVHVCVVCIGDWQLHLAAANKNDLLNKRCEHLC